jgi:hypothetical protein
MRGLLACRLLWGLLLLLWAPAWLLLQLLHCVVGVAGIILQPTGLSAMTCTGTGTPRNRSGAQSSIQRS